MFCNVMLEKKSKPAKARVIGDAVTSAVVTPSSVNRQAVITVLNDAFEFY